MPTPIKAIKNRIGSMANLIPHTKKGGYTALLILFDHLGNLDNLTQIRLP